jgi:hypothetical protein
VKQLRYLNFVQTAAQALIASAIAFGPLAGSSVAQNASPVILWRNLHSEMTKKEVKALYPDYKWEIAPRCQAKVLSNYKNKKLVSVILLGTDRNSNCTDQIFADLRVSYGDGKASNESQANMPLLYGSTLVMGSLPRRDINWRAEGRRITLSILATNPRTYNVIYTVREDGKLY